MFLQQSGIDHSESTSGAAEYGIDIFPGQTRGINDTVDICMPCMDVPRKRTAGRMIPRIYRIGRCANSSASVPTQINQRQSLLRLHRNLRPTPGRNFLHRNLAALPLREPVSHHRLNESRGELRCRVEHGEAAISRTKARIGRTCSQRVLSMAVRHDAVTARNLRRYQDGLDPASGIGVSAHVNVSPNPEAAPSTSSMRPAFSRSSGSATVSSNSHS